MIRLKKLLENVLAERVSDVVFHATDVYNLKSIIESDTFKLGKFDWEADVKWANDKNLSGYYYMSVARSVSSDFLQYDELVTMKLDGRKLNNVGKSMSYDFPYHLRKYGEYTAASFGDEMEDRILSKKRTIPNFTNYITAVWIPDSALDVIDDNIKFLGLFRKMEKINIPLYSCPRQDVPSFNNKCRIGYDKIYDIVNPNGYVL